jgi:signal transduction histidine kinase
VSARVASMFGRLSVQQSLALAIAPMTLVGALAIGVVTAALSTKEVALYHVRAGEQMTATLAQRSDLALLYESSVGVAEIATTFFDNPLVREIRVVGKEGKLLFGKTAGETRAWPYPPAHADGTAGAELDDVWVFTRQVHTARPARVDPDFPEAAFMTGTGNEVLGEVRLALSKDELFKTRRSIFFGNLFASLAFSLLAVGITLMIVRRMTHPLESLALTMHEARTGQWTEPPVLQGPREIRDIGESYQALMAALRQREEQLRDFNQDLEERIRQRTQALEAANKELEAFSYSASHDLRAPLRAIDGFGKALIEDYGSSLDPTAMNYLNRMCAGASRMSDLIDDMLKLSRITRYDMQVADIDLSEMAETLAAVMRERNPDRQVDFRVTPGMRVRGDPNLLRIVLDNLLDNAWKYTGKVAAAKIDFGRTRENRETIYVLRDNGAGFDMRFADKLFGAFQRLHGKEFEGTGIGLAIVQRIVSRHGGRIWAEAEVDRGATFYFTLPD